MEGRVMLDRLEDWAPADREFLDGNVGGISARLEEESDLARLAALRILERTFYGPRPEVLAALAAREFELDHPLEELEEHVAGANAAIDGLLDSAGWPKDQREFGPGAAVYESVDETLVYRAPHAPVLESRSTTVQDTFRDVAPEDLG